VQELLSAAENIAVRLGAPEAGEYGLWLRDTVGALHANHREVPEALRDLDAPLATTNYDGILEEVTGWKPVTWRDGALVERVLRGDDKGVLHLHGYYEQPASVVLGMRSYADVLGSAHAQTVQQSLRLMNSLVFVGCGTGLVDPNLGALLRWTRGVFAGSGYRHFLLARADQVAALQKEHPAEERLFVISYGSNHTDLAPFLRGLRPPTGASPPPSAPVQPAPLPGRPRCIGRDIVVAAVASAMLQIEPAPVSIFGPPGIGKSTVALTALHTPAVAEHFGERRYLVRCDNATTAGAALLEIARSLAMGLEADGATPLAERVYDWLRAKPTAMVLDNIETPWEAEPVATEELLRTLAGIPRLALVVALRRASVRSGFPGRTRSN
jgi:SIR2-like domain/AAA domain